MSRKRIPRAFQRVRVRLKTSRHTCGSRRRKVCIEVSEGEDLMRTLALTVSLFSLASGLLLADKATDERLAEAAKAFGEIMSVPDKGIPGSVLNKAECVVVVPGMKKGGFIVGGSF